MYKVYHLTISHVSDMIVATPVGSFPLNDHHLPFSKWQMSLSGDHALNIDINKYALDASFLKGYYYSKRSDLSSHLT